MIRIFSPKSEFCETFKIDGGLHVLIKQPRKAGSFDRSNTTAGFLVFDDISSPGISFIQEKIDDSPMYMTILESIEASGIGIYAPKVALLPPEGGTNKGLLSHLSDREGISVGIINPIDLGLSGFKKAIRAIGRDHKVSLMASALTRHDTVQEARNEAMELAGNGLAPVWVRADADNSKLEKTLRFLKDAGLIRAEILAAVELVVGKFILNRMDNKNKSLGRRDLVDQVDRLIRQSSDPQVA